MASTLPGRYGFAHGNDDGHNARLPAVTSNPPCSQPFFLPLSCTVGPLTVDQVGSRISIYENKWSQGAKCIFKGRPRPQITWYKHGSNLKAFNHTEVETLQDNGIFKVTTTLHVPGGKEYSGRYFCFGNNSLSSGWSSSKEPEEGIELSFKYEQSLG